MVSSIAFVESIGEIEGSTGRGRRDAIEREIC